MTPHDLPRALYTAAQTRELDRLAIAGGIPGDVLMTRAGEAAFLLLRETWPHAREVAVVCGSGNNGGDGYVVALLAAHAGLHPVVYARTPVAELKGDARVMAERAQAEQVPVVEIGAGVPDFAHADVLVDALFGTGLRGPVRDDVAPLIQAMNQSGRPILAIDIPSGLSADSGAAPGVAVRADHTITFIGVKRGLVTGEGPMLTGGLHFDDLRVPEDVFEAVPADCLRPGLQEFLEALGRRSAGAHKGNFGHVLVVGGDHGYPGAPAMAARAAARCGAGLVTIATRREHAGMLAGVQPEIMVRGVDRPEDLDPLLERATVIVAGPGLGQGSWGRSVLGRLLTTDLPRVLDADALNLLVRFNGRPGPDHQVLTPHPGEAGRLLGIPTGAVQQDRFAAVKRLHERYGGTALLKGAGTLVAAAGRPLALNTSGNPGMASGGMGDVLSGVIGALLAQGLAPWDAARFGALIHGLAADRAARHEGERGLLATDLLPHLRRLVNGKGENHGRT